MAAETALLDLVTPTQGTLPGSWGNTVNNGITEYVDIAIAGTLSLVGDGAVTLQNTIGDATQTNIVSTLSGAGTVTAQFAVVRITGTLTTTKAITGPSTSKLYLVDNAATGGAVSFLRSGQATPVTVAAGESAFVYYNGTDYIKVTSDLVLGGYTSTATAAGTTTLTAASTQNQFFTGTTTQTIVLPVAATLVLGVSFSIHNNSTGSLTVNSSGGNLVGTVNANTTMVFTCILTSGTDAASWDADVTGFTSTLPIVRGGTGISSVTSGGVVYAASSSALAAGSALQFDGSNLGVGATPSAWDSGWKVLQIGAGANFVGRTSVVNQLQLIANAYYNGTNYVYQNTGEATQYYQTGGTHAWAVAPSGTAGNTATFTNALTLDSARYLSGVWADKVTALGTVTTAGSIVCNSGNVFTATLGGNCTFTLSASSSTTGSTATSFTLILTNDGTAGRTVSWAGGTFLWPGGAASLSRTTSAGATDIWFFFTPNAGATWYGNISQKNLIA